MIANQAAGELRLAIVTILLIAFVPARTNAQPIFIQPQADYGGQLVQEMVPYQPRMPSPSEVVCSAPPLDQTPIYLDSCPEFCQSEVFQQAKPQATEHVPSGFREGLFQKLFFSGTWIPQFDDDSLGFSELETGLVFGVPFFRVSAPLLITPRFAVHYLDGPTTPDLPARVFDAEVSFRHLRKFGKGPWAMNAAVTLGQYSDFESSDADAFRVTGQALAVYESSPAAQWVLGVAYLNREDISILPVGGVIYQPTPDVKYEAILPRPRIAWRLSDGERWAYVAGEFGGGIWSIERRPIPAMPTLVQDLLTYTDFRLYVGVERKIPGGLSRRIEVGYVFGRELEFASATPNVRLDNSLFVRGGLTY
ncbi:MAG: hypothetical protein GXP24_10735 [Planctomycetes bacterium]|nr:hypothetical protein [Planctomycetota bacterium]